MSRVRAAAPTFWPVGGDVLASGRPLDAREAESLERFYAAAYDVAVNDGDTVAATFLSQQHEELLVALRSAARWRRAGAAAGARIC